MTLCKCYCTWRAFPMLILLSVIYISMQLAGVDNNKEFKDLLGSDEYDFRYDCGVTKPCHRIPYSDKENPITLRKVFRPPEIQITSEIIQDMFLPSLSAKGSNKRNVEEAIVMTWIQYLQSLEGMSFSEIA